MCSRIEREANALLHTTAFSATGGGSSPPAPSVTFATIPSGLCARNVVSGLCNGNLVSSNYRVVVLWCSPTGCAPGMGEGIGSLTAASQFVKVTLPASTPPPKCSRVDSWRLQRCPDSWKSMHGHRVSASCGRAQRGLRSKYAGGLCT
jgi:hypothetical protein